MSRKLYVGNLPYNLTPEQLGEIFTKIGTVEKVRIILDHLTQYSKGFGFVELGDEAQAAAAIAQMHDQEYFGRRLKISYARDSDRTSR